MRRGVDALKGRQAPPSSRPHPSSVSFLDSSTSNPWPRVAGGRASGRPHLPQYTAPKPCDAEPKTAKTPRQRDPLRTFVHDPAPHVTAGAISRIAAVDPSSLSGDGTLLSQLSTGVSLPSTSLSRTDGDGYAASADTTRAGATSQPTSASVLPPTLPADATAAAGGDATKARPYVDPSLPASRAPDVLSAWESGDVHARAAFKEAMRVTQAALGAQVATMGVELDQANIQARNMAAMWEMQLAAANVEAARYRAAAEEAIRERDAVMKRLAYFEAGGPEAKVEEPPPIDSKEDEGEAALRTISGLRKEVEALAAACAHLTDQLDAKTAALRRANSRISALSASAREADHRGPHGATHKLKAELAAVRHQRTALLAENKSLRGQLRTLL